MDATQYAPSSPLEPPEYAAVQRPTTTITYTFSPISSDAMLLIPSPDAPDSRPRYHISVRTNCFIPSSYITTVRSGASESGNVVGDFELGISDQPATVSIREKEYFMWEALKRRSGNRKAGIWAWNFMQTGLYWDCQDTTEQKCYSPDKQTLYATFKPIIKTNQTMRRPNQPVAATELQVTPTGHEFFDDILLSTLILERWRLSPAPPHSRTMFNFPYQ